MLTIPKILDTQEFLGAPLDFKWDKGTSTYFYVDSHNEKIAKAFWAINHKATLGIATALGEWVLWRLSKHSDRPLINQALEAQYAGIVDKHYMVDWRYEGDYNSELVDGPLWAMLQCLQYPRGTYIDGKYFINKKVSNLAVLARHLSPKQIIFDNWFNYIMKKASHLFPSRYDYSEILKDIDAYEKKRYNSSDEPAIPRNFFWEEEFDYQIADKEGLINEFLSSLDYKSNEFLNPPKTMLKSAFQGTPYKYE